MKANQEEFVSALIGKWYECAPYGEQVPEELPRLLAKFCETHGMLNAEGMLEQFCKANPDDPILQLFECIFAEGANFAISRLADAVFDRDVETLKLIDLQEDIKVGGNLRFFKATP